MPSAKGWVVSQAHLTGKGRASAGRLMAVDRQYLNDGRAHRADASRGTAELLSASGELRVAVGRIARRMKQLYETDEVTFSETLVLSRLQREGPSSPGVLAEREHVRPQAMVATLRALEQRGLVVRTADPTDGRHVVVALTRTGRAALQDRSHALTRRMARILADEFSPDEQRRLREALPLLERLGGLL